MSPEHDPTPHPSDAAPERPLPSNHLYSIEYPGYVRETSVPYAVQTLGGQSSLEAAFRRNASRQDALLELNLRPENPFSHPIPGDVVPTNNIVLKVVKRKRRRLNAAGEEEIVGEYTTEAVGMVPKTVRFRSMVDYQYQPNANDPVTKLRMAMANLDVDAIREYRIPREKEDYLLPAAMNVDIDPALLYESTKSQSSNPETSNLRLFPPPLFTRQGVPQNYFFKANPMSVITTAVDEETGEEKKRLINKMRWKGYGPATIMYADAEVPTKPPPHVEEVRDQFDKKLVAALEARFKERPIWTRAALFNQFSTADARTIHNSKVILPLCCYVFQDGPWRDTMLRFGYDPRKHVEARFYQRLYFRNLNHPIARPSVVSRRQETRYSLANQNRVVENPADEGRRSHVFDGLTVTSETAAFQLCDIVDPMLRKMIEDESDLRDTCNERDGWYTTHALERIKAVLRHKFFSLLEGYVASDEECLRLLDQQAESKTVKPLDRKLKPSKHNMAKGALPPEDVAAMRLRATLDRNAKNFRGVK
ncbi:RNA polymerase III transcription factor IIIC subunit-domain-containing protein [Vararia minispora EC-137]|uniref:RNA polymerase III transcription factor IIIC subunit-domain-containing protein n=1 Tax=Vararia minispora EC-137 TaxID=1314806 RepID=A0ACB8QRK4_9AGAM|nr:RNA polymerase III transcription factor IIIC subunit-domain-containing protein [Vararia minispora EC-137]